MSTSRFEGVLAPVITPFREDLSPDAERLARHCQWLVSQGAGLAVFGTNSEANSLSVKEKIELMEALCEAGIDPASMMPGTSASAVDSPGQAGNRTSARKIAGSQLPNA